MAYAYLNYVLENKIEDIKKVCKVYSKEQIKNHQDVELRSLFGEYDYMIEITDYDKIIESSVLQNELSKIEKLKMTFQELNDTMLKEKGFAEIDELEDTSDKEILNRKMCLDLRRRGLKFTNQDNVYFKNKEDESYNDIKSYFLDIHLSWKLNHNFEAIAKRLKQGIASKKQEFTFFRAVDQVSDGIRKYVVVMPELKYNNERFGKEIYKIFIPYTSLVMCEIIQVVIPESRTWKETGYPLISAYDKRVIEIQRVGGGW